ncbi:hypothetical protein [Streptomyces sp. NPDC094032]|uniref:hypothetical protein n=1 Tax=Streptomyces sp. NPDC094032 TaxID=3155308 RepID=UPI00331A4E1B
MLTSSLPVEGWWAVAVLSGTALGIAAASLTVTWKHRIASLAVPVATAAGMAGQAAARGYEAKEALFLFTLLSLTLTVMRLVFAPWITRQRALQRAGVQPDGNVRKQTAVFLATFVAVLIAVGFLLG